MCKFCTTPTSEQNCFRADVSLCEPVLRQCDLCDKTFCANHGVRRAGAHTFCDTCFDEMAVAAKLRWKDEQKKKQEEEHRRAVRAAEQLKRQEEHARQEAEDARLQAEIDALDSPYDIIVIDNCFRVGLRPAPKEPVGQCDIDKLFAWLTE